MPKPKQTASGTLSLSNATGWGPVKRAARLKRLGKAGLHALLMLVCKMVRYWDSTEGATLAVYRQKRLDRAFAWGVQAWLSLLSATHSDSTVWLRVARREASVDDQHLLCLAVIMRECAPSLGFELYSEEGIQYLRAAYMTFVLTFQPGEPQGAEGITDLPRLEVDTRLLAQQLGLSVADLYAMAERESVRPGCQYGVLLRVARQRGLFVSY